MLATKRARPRLANRRTQQGVAAVEFSLVALLFFTLVFGIIEVARAMYVCNTLQEVTRRAALLARNEDFSNGAAIQKIREQAIFRNDPGFLVFAQPVSDQNINIDYMRIRSSETAMTMERIPDGALPANPTQNKVNCAADPHGASCIRFVRVRVCQETSGETCTRVTYRSLVSLIPMPFDLPRAVTIAQAETLGTP